jgi:hypothetical protein
MDGMSLLDVLRGVMLDPAEQAVYDADPGAYLGQYGYQDVDPADLSDAFGLVADTLPADQAMTAWTGESGPESPILGDDTSDFDVGGPDEATGLEAIDVLDGDGPDDVDDAGIEAGDTASDDGDDLGDEAPLSFGVGEEADGDEPTGLGTDDLDADLGLFGTAAPDDADTGDSALDPTLDDFGDEGFDELVTTFDAGDATHDDLDPQPGEGHLDEADDLGEIDGLGPLGNDPDDLDIGSF